MKLFSLLAVSFTWFFLACFCCCFFCLCAGSNWQKSQEILYIQNSGILSFLRFPISQVHSPSIQVNLIVFISNFFSLVAGDGAASSKPLFISLFPALYIIKWPGGKGGSKCKVYLNISPFPCIRVSQVSCCWIFSIAFQHLFCLVYCSIF